MRINPVRKCYSSTLGFPFGCKHKFGLMVIKLRISFLILYLSHFDPRPTSHKILRPSGPLLSPPMQACFTSFGMVSTRSKMYFQSIAQKPLHVKAYCRRSATLATMKQNAFLFILAFCFVILPALGQRDAGETLASSNESANASERVNSSIPTGEQFAMVNIFQVAEENPIDPKLGYMQQELISGKEASVNMTLYLPDIYSWAHYHNATDEIDYVVKGQANLTMNGTDYPVKAGDLIYIPPFNAHNYTAMGNETFQIMVFFVPAFDGKDRVFV